MIQCPDCDAQVAKELAQRARRDADEAMLARIARSGLPADYRSGKRSLTLMPPIAQQAIAVCETLDESGGGLYLYGPAGSYKTSVAAAFLASRIRKGASGRYVFVPDLMSDVHASYRSNDTESRSELISRCVATPLLVLDDLGKEKASEHAAGVIFEILDGRYRDQRQGRWLIVTSNFDLDALCDRFPGEEFSDPIRRRLAEMTVSVPMERT